MTYTPDYLLRGFARDAVRLVGGWRHARLLLRGSLPDNVGSRARSPRGIRIRHWAMDNHNNTGE